MTWSGITRERRGKDLVPDPRIERGESEGGLFHFRCRVCGEGCWIAPSDIKHLKTCIDPRKANPPSQEPLPPSH